ncbi:hypothetical protein DL546_000489 [Coniochaeta pulveracea]|uniref:Ubiquitinyl hydrolase 1 n=1 Tax=Coniochaeta pulveracea TaxID=177199 RepID=A0A420Y8R0_9PEZI|nr:hypothetical protein DL546_000489 [Coniochaeta pulveracea]
MQSEFVQIFDAILQLIPFPDGRIDAVDMLVHRFNDADNANNLLYYARLLASSWLKSGTPEAEDYVPFLLDMGGIDEYCDNVINIPNREIEEVGLRILWNVLLKPTDMVLEIAYLDRSVGEEVNTYRIPDEATGRDPSTLGPLICLLFRPDHYDILYRHPAPALVPDHSSGEAAIHADLQVNRVAHLSYDQQNTAHTTLQDYYQDDADNVLLSLIPGLGAAGSAAATVPAFWDVAGSHMSPYTPSPQPSWAPSPFNNDLSISLRQSKEQPQLDAAQLAPAEPVPAVQPSRTATTPPFRLSEHCYHQVNGQGLEKEGWQEPTFSTATFKNSCFNTAHFQNPNFHPEEYHPDQEEDDHEVAKAARPRKGRGT